MSKGYFSVAFGAVARPIAFAMALTGAASVAFAATSDSSDWSASLTSQLRLLSGGPIAAGRYRGGVEIFLRPGAVTYWRVPGDAGVAPEFSFDGSDNLANAEVHYPAPHRYDVGGSQEFGYRTDVIFPIDVTAEDPHRPVTVALTVNYAVCDTICVPATGHASLAFDPTEKPGEPAPRIADFMSRVPLPFGAPGAPSVAVTPVPGAAKKTWHVAIRPAPSADADLFADPPDDWWFDTKATDGGFDVILAQKPPDAALPAHVALTYVQGDKAYETDTILSDVAPQP